MAAVLLLVLTLQGPILAYAPALMPCSSMPNRANCDHCCSHGQCAALCAHSIVALTPGAPAIVRLQGAAAPDLRVASFLGANPAPPYRPPIVWS